GARVPPPRAPLLKASVITADNATPREITAPIPHSHRSLRFTLAAPEFARREALRIETLIEGIDRDWTSVGKDSLRELSAVRDGNYRLLARTVSDAGAVSEPVEFRFRVLSPWWRTPPMLALFAFGLAPVAYGLFYLRTRALRRRNVELEARVQERTEELEAANQQLAAASAAKTEFVAGMSHDIRNPLNGIVGLALALEDSKLDGRQREMVATLRECSGYLSTLVDDVLDFASIEAGKIELRPGPLAPGELLRSVVTTLKSDTAERGATLLYEVDPSLPSHLLGDAGRVQQILVNFVSNALKYAGGTIQLSASRPANAPGEVEFAVRDWGQGMNKDEVAALFTKFSRLTRSRQEGITGTGLGLASCRLLADIMGGSVGVESEPGNGSRFYLRLPLTVVVSTPEQAPETLPQAAVLLVEDTDYNAWAAKAVLARLGLACDRARTGAEAVRMFEEKRYNVVLLDRNLPDMDGLEVSKRIRASETDGLQSVILAVTAYATAQDRQLCLDAGMDAFVGKPLTPDKLRRTLLGAGRKLLAAATVDLSRPASTPPMSTPSASSPTPSSEPAELDLGLLTYLSDGTPESFNAQVQRFLETLITTQDELAVALAAGDFEQVKVFAHRVGGQAKMVGFAPLEEASVRLEEIAFQHDATGCIEEADRVRQSIAALKAAMARPSRSMSPA
ncbi:MAG TPA: ATP-binding protein, partial [Opitutaceae bacterium]